MEQCEGQPVAHQVPCRLLGQPNGPPQAQATLPHLRHGLQGCARRHRAAPGGRPRVPKQELVAGVAAEVADAGARL